MYFLVNFMRLNIYGRFYDDPSVAHLAEEVAKTVRASLGENSIAIVDAPNGYIWQSENPQAINMAFESLKQILQTGSVNSYLFQGHDIVGGPENIPPDTIRWNRSNNSGVEPDPNV